MIEEQGRKLTITVDNETLNLLELVAWYKGMTEKEYLNEVIKKAVREDFENYGKK